MTRTEGDRTMASTSAIRVGNAAGFWGDNLDAPASLAREGDLDVLTLEYLAELTLAILAHLRSKDPRAGFVGDFPELLEKLGPILKEQPKLRIVTNAGGLNPESCARRCAAILSRIGLEKTPIAVISGDDVLDRIAGWRRRGIDLSHFETGEPLGDSIAERLASANVYLGAPPIVEGLNQGARIAIAGRVADASLALAPAWQAFGWRATDYDLLAGASVAGHLIECGAQATGGLRHDWNAVEDLAGIGYPIAEIRRDGSTILTKPAGSGGLVSVSNVAEQLVYEIDDPRAYRTPDVNVDLAAVELSPAGRDRVLVAGAKGDAPGSKLKVSAVYRDGWTAAGMLAVVGRDAEAKARAAGRIVLERVRRAGFELRDSLVECLGAGDVVPGVLPKTGETFEVVLRVAARDPRREAIERFCREFAPLVTSGPSGIAGYATGRPSPKPAFGYWPTLVDRSLVQPLVQTRTAADWNDEASSNRS